MRGLWEELKEVAERALRRGSREDKCNGGPEGCDRRDEKTSIKAFE